MKTSAIYHHMRHNKKNLQNQRVRHFHTTNLITNKNSEKIMNRNNCNINNYTTHLNYCIRTARTTHTHH